MATLEERFLNKVVKTDYCWIWTGAKSNGYGYIGYKDKVKKAATVSYELWVGEVPSGLKLDHTCHNIDKDCLGGKDCKHRACVNPIHLEPVSNRVNLLRGKTIAAENAKKIYCINGHLLSGDNVHLQKEKSGKYYRRCRECNKIKAREYRALLKGNR